MNELQHAFNLQASEIASLTSANRELSNMLSAILADCQKHFSTPIESVSDLRRALRREAKSKLKKERKLRRMCELEFQDREMEKSASLSAALSELETKFAGAVSGARSAAEDREAGVRNREFESRTTKSA
jgi:hypothetical protein